jgi:transcriptional regulator with XRE-family HTH domain
MKDPYHQALRHMRRSAGLTQDDVAHIVGVGGRSYIAMLEAGDRVPHVRDVIMLSMLFGTSEVDLFPQVYLTSKEQFTSNATKLITLALEQGEDPGGERLKYIRNALTNVQLTGNIDSAL